MVGRRAGRRLASATSCHRVTPRRRGPSSRGRPWSASAEAGSRGWGRRPSPSPSVRQARHACRMDVEGLLPADALRPRWSSASALVYLGGFVALLATSVLLGILGDDHGDWALVGYSALASALAAIRRFRAPLLMLPIALTFWIAIADLGSIGSWDDAEEVLAILVGI